MLSQDIKKAGGDLSAYDKALLIQYLFDTLNQSEDQDNLKAWIEESERRYEAVKKGELEVIDYSDIKKQLA